MSITDADREAAKALRVILADISGYWHKPGDDSPLCQALAQHREAAEACLATKLTPLTLGKHAMPDAFDFGRTPRNVATLSRGSTSPIISRTTE